MDGIAAAPESSFAAVGLSRTGWREVAMLCYFNMAVVMTKNTFAMSLPDLMARYPEEMPRVMTILPAAVMFGKLFWGPCTDRFGEMYIATHYFCGALVMLLGGLFIHSSLPMFGLCWLVCDVFFGGNWGAVMSIVRRSYSEEQRPVRLGFIGASTRLGVLTAFWVLGFLVRIGFTSAHLHYFASAVLFVGFLLWLYVVPRIQKRYQVMAEHAEKCSQTGITSSVSTAASGGVRGAGGAAAIDGESSAGTGTNTGAGRSGAEGATPGTSAVVVAAPPRESVLAFLGRMAIVPESLPLLLGRASTMCILAAILHFPAFFACVISGDPARRGEAADEGAVLQASAASTSLFGLGGLLASLFGGAIYGHFAGNSNSQKPRMILSAITSVCMFAPALYLYSVACRHHSAYSDHPSLAPIAGGGAVSAAVAAEPFQASLASLGAAAFSMGFGLAFSHFVISQVLISDIAGASHTAVLTNVLDASGWAVLGPYQGNATRYGAVGDWRFFTAGLVCFGLATFGLLIPMATNVARRVGPNRFSNAAAAAAAAEADASTAAGEDASTSPGSWKNSPGAPSLRNSTAAVPLVAAGGSARALRRGSASAATKSATESSPGDVEMGSGASCSAAGSTAGDAASNSSPLSETRELPPAAAGSLTASSVLRA